MSIPTLEFTGERFTPECVREIWYEHIHRYAFAARLARGRRVLDAACGEGYGSALLAAGGGQVLGLDVSSQAIEHARQRYQHTEGLDFQLADVTRLEQFAPASFDLVCSFETLEHVEAQEAMLDGLARLLAPGGLLLVSTPDKRTYSDLTGFRNEFHTRELYRDEFDALLRARFPAVRLLGQKLLFQSVLWDAAGGNWEADTIASDRREPGLAYEPLYWLAACSDQAGSVEALPALHLFGDATESVYAHYNHEIRQNMRAGQRIQELEAEVESLRAQLASAKEPQRDEP
jgi:SAM-dependent methyltransferase